jgi:hypothetical protein
MPSFRCDRDPHDFGSSFPPVHVPDAHFSVSPPARRKLTEASDALKARVVGR